MRVFVMRGDEARYYREAFYYGLRWHQDFVGVINDIGLLRSVALRPTLHFGATPTSPAAPMTLDESNANAALFLKITPC